MRCSARWVVVGIALAIATPALAQPANKDASANKGDAKALMQSGLKLLEAKDYLGALAVFKDAYTQFPSPKILLNIGTTLKLLGREADAANAYQRYLDTNDSDAKRRADIVKLVADIDKTVGVVDLTVTPAGAEVQIGNDDWTTAESVKHVRVPTDKVAVRARLDGYEPKTTAVQVAAGEHAAIEIHLIAVEKPATSGAVTPPSGGAIVVTPQEHGPRSRFGVIVLGHIDIPYGWAPLIGVTADVIPRLQIDATAIIGSYYGAYVGGRYAILLGTYRPYVAAGLPVFSSHGLRYGARGAGGFEYEINRHLAVIGEVGVEHDFNVEMGKVKTLFVPAVGVTGRL